MLNPILLLICVLLYTVPYAYMYCQYVIQGLQPEGIIDTGVCLDGNFVQNSSR
jgi:hypothetical protein